MIELTEEMRTILDRAAGREHSRDGAVMRTLREILDVVERDYLVEPRAPREGQWRCIKCGSQLGDCADPDCVDPAQYGEVWCAHHAHGSTP